MKIAVITCYKQPDYVRALTLRAALQSDSSNKVFVIKNSQRGILRYIEVLAKIVAVRLRYRPDVYLVTFRGYEILPAINILTWPKKLVFDEFINPLEWLHEPRPEAWAKYVPHKALRSFYRFLLRRPSLVLADTSVHAEYSAELTYGQTMAKKFRALPVGTDETVFTPQVPTKIKDSLFRVFYYGNMLPLHGLKYVLEAAVNLKDSPIEFSIVGGKEDAAKAVTAAVAKGAHIEYKHWVPYKDLPKEIAEADLCLGGPFGDTTQAQHVITGKTYQFLACAVPTLVGNTLASTDFKDKKNCLKVKLGDASSLSSAIRWASLHPQELSDIGKNGRLLYEEKFSVAALTPKLKDLLEHL